MPQANESAPNEDEQMLLDAWNLAVLSGELRQRIAGHGPAAIAIVRDIEELSILLSRLLAATLRAGRKPFESAET
jgi:hypothetical protein